MISIHGRNAPGSQKGFPRSTHTQNRVKLKREEKDTDAELWISASFTFVSLKLLWIVSLMKDRTHAVLWVFIVAYLLTMYHTVSLYSRNEKSSKNFFLSRKIWDFQLPWNNFLDFCALWDLRRCAMCHVPWCRISDNYSHDIHVRESVQQYINIVR